MNFIFIFCIIFQSIVGLQKFWIHNKQIYVLHFVPILYQKWTEPWPQNRGMYRTVIFVYRYTPNIQFDTYVTMVDDFTGLSHRTLTSHYFLIVHKSDDSCGRRPRGLICSTYTADKIKGVIRLTQLCTQTHSQSTLSMTLHDLYTRLCLHILWIMSTIQVIDQ